MTKSEILKKVEELIAAPSCCADVKNAAEAYQKKQSKENADKLIEALKANVNSIDETIALAESDFGKKLFGEETANKMAVMGKDLKSKGEKYCFCPACSAGSVIYENKEAL